MRVIYCSANLAEPWHVLFFQYRSTFPGPCSEKGGYTIRLLKSSSPDQIKLTNGIALEMFTYYKTTAGEDYQKGIKQILRLSGIQQTITPKLLNTARTYLNRLHLKKQTLRAFKLDSFLQETFKRFPASRPPPTAWSSPSSSPSPSLSVSNTSSASTTTPYVSVLQLSSFWAFCYVPAMTFLSIH